MKLAPAPRRLPGKNAVISSVRGTFSALIIIRTDLPGCTGLRCSVNDLGCRQISARQEHWYPLQ